MAKLRLTIYAATAFGGIVWPWYCIYQFIQETEALGLTDPLEIVDLFSQGVWANASAGFIAADDCWHSDQLPPARCHCR